MSPKLKTIVSITYALTLCTTTALFAQKAVQAEKAEDAKKTASVSKPAATPAAVTPVDLNSSDALKLIREKFLRVNAQADALRMKAQLSVEAQLADLSKESEALKVQACSLVLPKDKLSDCEVTITADGGTVGVRTPTPAPATPVTANAAPAAAPVRPAP